MVIGLDLFTEYFKEYTAHYILIGGSACDRYFEERGIDFRVTKDLDIILVVEALKDEFVNHFWQFIKDGEYTLTERGGTKQFYRFVKPKTKGYPFMIELFSRKPDLIKEIEGIHLTDIPTSEEVSSLSAILMDDDYYHFTIENSTILEGLRHANDIALIVLKAKAFLNNRQRAEEGQKVQEDDILKHRRDVIRLTAILTPDKKVDIPESIKNDLIKFIDVVKKENLDITELLKRQGITGVTLSDIFDQIEATFKLAPTAS